MRPESQARMRLLEQRLNGSLRGGATTRRNPALDILTGRTADIVIDTRPLLTGGSAAAAAVARVTAPAANQQPLLLLRPSVPPIDARRRFRIERTAPPPRANRRPVVLLGAGAAAVVIIGVTAFALTRGSAPTAETLTVMAATTQDVVPTLEPVAERPDVRVDAPAVAESAAATGATVVSAVPAAPPAHAPAPAASPVVEAPAATANPNPPTPAPANELQVLVDERFAPSMGSWPGEPDGTVWLANGAYRLRASQPTHFVAVGIPGTDELADAIVTADFHKIGGPAGGGYGLILRDQGPGPRDGLNQHGRFYVFEVGDQGELGVWLRDDDRWVDLLTWTHSDAVKPGNASNELTVTAIDNRLSFLVNGIPVASQVDAVLHTGAAGIFTGGDGNDVSVDRITVRVPR